MTEATSYTQPLDTAQTDNGKQVLCDDSQGMGRVGKEQQPDQLVKVVVNLPNSDQHMDQVPRAKATPQNPKPKHPVTRVPFGVITNQIKEPLSLPRKWKKLARKAGKRQKREKLIMANAA